jgi:16S rRNA (cytidine1402-2'-O)-methyltransferase
MGTLYLVSTPIGNLEDITLRALRVLRECALIAPEDTRTARRLLDHFNIDKPLISYFEHNKLTRLDRILDALEAGDVALISEAGTPVLSDPGYELVRTAIERGFRVVPVPGASAVTTALSVSGLPADRFLYMGFLPRRTADRRRVLSEVATERAALVLFEAPHRLLATLADAQEMLGGHRRCTICREMTKLHEEIWRGTLSEALSEWYAREPRGEFTLVITGAAPPVTWDEEQVRSALADLLAVGMSHSEAARQVARQSGWSKSAVYALCPAARQ